MTVSNNKRIKEAYNYLLIIAGSFLMAFGIVGFLNPNHVATGGTAGLAIVLNSIFSISIGAWMAIINIPLLLISMKYFGKNFAIKTITCIGSIILFVDLLAHWPQIKNLSHELLLATLYGGIIIGAGLGLVFKGGASAGGGTILAKLIATNTTVKTSTVILILDGIVVCSAGLVFGSIELALWSLISIYVTSKLIDVVLLGAQNQKIVHISSRRNLTELSLLISRELGTSGTIVKGHDLGNTEYKDIIFLMIEKSRLNALKQLALDYDENVKMIVMEASEVLGRELKS